MRTIHIPLSLYREVDSTGMVAAAAGVPAPRGRANDVSDMYTYAILNYSYQLNF